MSSKSSALSLSFSNSTQANSNIKVSNYTKAIFMGCSNTNINLAHSWFVIMRQFNELNWHKLEKERFDNIYNGQDSSRRALEDLRDIMDNTFETKRVTKLPTRKNNKDLIRSLAIHCDSNHLLKLSGICFSDVESEVLKLWIQTGQTDNLKCYITYLCNNCHNDEQDRRNTQWSIIKYPFAIVFSLGLGLFLSYIMVGISNFGSFMIIAGIISFVILVIFTFSIDL